MQLLNKAFPYLLLLYGIIIFSYLLGHFLFTLLVNYTLKNTTAFFVKIVVGLTTIITSVAIWKTGGQTFSLFFVALALAIYVYYQKNKIAVLTPKKYFPFKELDLFSYLIFIFLPFIFYALRIVENGNWQIAEMGLHWDLLDHAMYAHYADGLDFGIESRYAVLNQWKPIGIDPYHYYEIWFIYTFSKITGLLSFYIYELVAFPFFNFLVFLSYCALYETLAQKSGQVTTKMYCLLVILLAAIWLNPDFLTFDFIRKLGFIVYWNDTQFFTSMYVMKIAVLKIYFSLFLILWFNNQKTPALIILLALPICNILTAPAILGGLGVYLLANFRYKWISQKSSYYLMALMISFVIFIGLLLWFGNFGSDAIPTTTKVSFFVLLQDIPAIFIKFIHNELLKYLLLYAIFIFITLFFIATNKKISVNFNHSLLFFIVMMLIALGTATVINNQDSYQIYKLITVIIVDAVIIMITLSYFINIPKNNSYSNHKIISFILFFGMIALLGMKNIISRNIGFDNVKHLIKGEKLIFPPVIYYSKPYLDSVHIILKDLETDQSFNKFGIGLSDSSNYHDNFTIYPVCYQGFAYYLAYTGNNYTTINTSLYKVKHRTDKVSTQKFIKNDVFIQFAAKQQANNKFENYSKTLFEFTKTYQIRYAIATKEAIIEPDLQPLVQKIITDEVSGERFILLKKL